MMPTKKDLMKRGGISFSVFFAYSCVCTCVLAFVFTLVSASHSLWSTLLIFVLCMVSSFLGFFSRGFAARKNKRWFLILAVVLGGVICAVFGFICVFCAMHFDLALGIVMGVFSILPFVVGWQIRRTKFSKLSSTLMILVCLGVHTAVYFLSFLIQQFMHELLPREFPFDTYIYLLFPVIIILFLLRNQSNLDELMTYGRLHISKSRSNNRMSILFSIAAIALIFVLFFFWNPILQMLSFVGAYLKYGLDVVLQWFFALISSNEEAEMKPSEPLNLPGGGGTSFFWMTFMAIAIVFVIGILLYTLLPSVFAAIRDSLISLIQKVRSRFSRKATIQDGDRKYYYDNISVIERDDRDTHSRSLVRAESFRKFSRKYRRCADPVEQVRLCYAYTLALLRTTNDPPLDSDTPLEILHRMLENKKVGQKVDLTGITELYSDVRYALQSPSKEKNDQMYEQVKLLSQKIKIK